MQKQSLLDIMKKSPLYATDMQFRSIANGMVKEAVEMKDSITNFLDGLKTPFASSIGGRVVIDALKVIASSSPVKEVDAKVLIVEMIEAHNKDADEALKACFVACAIRPAVEHSNYKFLEPLKEKIIKFFGTDNNKKKLSQFDFKSKAPEGQEKNERDLAIDFFLGLENPVKILEELDAQWQFEQSKNTSGHASQQTSSNEQTKPTPQTTSTALAHANRALWTLENSGELDTIIQNLGVDRPEELLATCKKTYAGSVKEYADRHSANYPLDQKDGLIQDFLKILTLLPCAVALDAGMKVSEDGINDFASKYESILTSPVVGVVIDLLELFMRANTQIKMGPMKSGDGTGKKQQYTQQEIHYINTCQSIAMNSLRSSLPRDAHTSAHHDLADKAVKGAWSIILKRHAIKDGVFQDKQKTEMIKTLFSQIGMAAFCSSLSSGLTSDKATKINQMFEQALAHVSNISNIILEPDHANSVVSLIKTPKNMGSTSADSMSWFFDMCSTALKAATNEIQKTAQIMTSNASGQGIPEAINQAYGAMATDGVADQSNIGNIPLVKELQSIFQRNATLQKEWMNSKTITYEVATMMYAIFTLYVVKAANTGFEHFVAARDKIAVSGWNGLSSMKAVANFKPPPDSIGAQQHGAASYSGAEINLIVKAMFAGYQATATSEEVRKLKDENQPAAVDTYLAKASKELEKFKNEIINKKIFIGDPKNQITYNQISGMAYHFCIALAAIYLWKKGMKNTDDVQVASRNELMSLLANRGVNPASLESLQKIMTFENNKFGKLERQAQLYDEYFREVHEKIEQANQTANDPKINALLANPNELINPHNVASKLGVTNFNQGELATASIMIEQMIRNKVTPEEIKSALIRKAEEMSSNYHKTHWFSGKSKQAPSTGGKWSEYGTILHASCQIFILGKMTYDSGYARYRG